MSEWQFVGDSQMGSEEGWASQPPASPWPWKGVATDVCQKGWQKGYLDGYAHTAMATAKGIKGIRLRWQALL